MQIKNDAIKQLNFDKNGNVPVESDYTLLLKELEQHQLDWILFASPSAVQNFQQILPAGFWLVAGRRI